MAAVKKIFIIFIIFAIFLPSQLPPPLAGGGWGRGNIAFAETGEDLLLKGIESYNSGDYAATQKILAKAIPLLKDSPKIIEAHKYLAFVYIAYGENQKAEDVFTEALKIDKAFRLDPKATSPKIMEVFRKAKAGIIAEGAISVITKPEGAKVYLDNSLIGETSLRQDEVLAGQHKVVIKKKGYEVIEGEITIKDKVMTNIEYTLSESTGILTVISEPSPAEVSFDSEPIGKSPIKLKNVSGGYHILKISKKYYDDFEKEMAFNKGEEKGLNITLKKRLVLIGPITEAGQTEGRAVARNLLIDSFKDLQAYQLIALTEDKEAEVLKQADVNIKTVLSHLLMQGGKDIKLKEFSEKLNSELFIIACLIKDKAGPKLIFTLFNSEMERPDIFVIDLIQEDVKQPLLKIRKALEFQPSFSKPAEIREEKGVILFNHFITRIKEMSRDSNKETAGIGYLNLGNYHANMKNWKEAIAAYNQVASANKTGIGKGTALFRIGEVYENLNYWNEAAEYYYRAMKQFPQNTIDSNDGEAISSASLKRLKRLYSMGLIRERYW
ncbi:MAG: PEGA domain-containing protein [Nitrospirae bacterium]|nr:PEGA domain-containing protein [Nitrospirota bacterium]